MANALVGKTLITINAILPNEETAEVFKDQLSGHLDFMQSKSYESGPLKLIHYSVSTGPEWKENASFLDGKMPEKTGRVVVTLIEIYETEDGLNHHWIESKEFHPLFEEWLNEVGGEGQIYSHQKIIQSLWD